MSKITATKKLHEFLWEFSVCFRADFCNFTSLFAPLCRFDLTTTATSCQDADFIRRYVSHMLLSEHLLLFEIYLHLKGGVSSLLCETSCRQSSG